MYYGEVLYTTQKISLSFLKLRYALCLPTENIYCRQVLCDFLNGGEK